MDAVDDPFEHAHVVAETGPEEAAVVVAAEPVHAEDARGIGDALAHVHPVAEIEGHVVAAKGQHGHRVAAHLPDLARGGGGGLAAHRRADVNAVRPVERLVDERHGGGAASAEDDGADGHALRVIRLEGKRRVVRHGRGEAAVGMRGFFLRGRSPFLTAPVEALGRRRVVVSLPPDGAVVLERDIGVDGVAGDGLHRVGIGLGAGAGRDTEVASLGIDGEESSVGAGLHPRDVVAEGPDLPPAIALGRDEHGEVGLAAGAGEGGGDVGLFAAGRLDAEDEHVLGEPAFLAPEIGTDAEGEAFLPKKHIAAVVRAGGDDGIVLGEMRDDATIGIGVESAVEAAIEISRFAEMVPGDFAHARHDAHRKHDVDGIGDLDAYLAERRSGRAHQVRHHIHGAPAHRAKAPTAEPRVHLGRRRPVVGGAGLLLRLGADVGALLDARDVVRVGAMVIAAGQLLLVELDENALRHGLLGEALLFGLGAIAPEDALGLAERDGLLDPLANVDVDGVGMVEVRRRHSVNGTLPARAFANRVMAIRDSRLAKIAGRLTSLALRTAAQAISQLPGRKRMLLSTKAGASASLPPHANQADQPAGPRDIGGAGVGVLDEPQALPLAHGADRAGAAIPLRAVHPQDNRG